MTESSFNWEGWIGAAILIGLLAVLVASLRQSAAGVDEARADLPPEGGVRGALLALVALLVFMAFQSLALLLVLGASLWNAVAEVPGGWVLFPRYMLPALLAFILYSGTVVLLVWVRKNWVPKAAAVLLWLAGPVPAIPAFAFFGAQPGPFDFGIPSALAVAGTLYLLLSQRVRSLYRRGARS